MFGRLLSKRWSVGPVISSIRPVTSMTVRYNSTAPAAAVAKAAPSQAEEAAEVFRQANAAPTSPRPKVFDRPGGHASASTYYNDGNNCSVHCTLYTVRCDLTDWWMCGRVCTEELKEVKRFTSENKQTFPHLPREVRESVKPEPKPRNKKISKIFAHARRVRLTQDRILFPDANIRPYFPPIRVNHTPKRIHTVADAAVAAPLSARMTTFLAAAAAGGIESVDRKLLISGESKDLTQPADDANGAPKPADRFAVVDVNSKQHKVTEGDLVRAASFDRLIDRTHSFSAAADAVFCGDQLMVDRMGEVGVGDQLSFDRILMVASSTCLFAFFFYRIN